MTLLDDATQHYVPYHDGIEEIEKDEQETFEKISKLMSEGADTVREKYGRPIRISHAKAHGALRGKLVVNSNLPEYLKQGLFSEAGKTYDVIIRLAHTPGELLDDRKVSTPRSFSFKVVGVEGESLQHGATSHGTQDFILANGKIFIAPGPKSFLQAFQPNAEIAPHLSDTTKGVVSSISRGTNAVLEAVGIMSGKLDFFGHPFLHPLSESYYSQTPFRYGDYISKFNLLPTTPGLKELADQKFEPRDENGLRTDVVDFFRNHDAEFSFGVQLATDLEKMPIENSNAEWPEDLSPYQPVARILIPAQDAYSPGRADYVEKLSFSPAHALAAHKPLGGLNRSRLHAYKVLSTKRRNELGVALSEPASIDQFPS